jgi:glucokinase
MFLAAEDLIKAHACEPAASGISCGDPLDAPAGVIQAPPNLPDWVEVPIVEMARARFKIPAFLENDANACALAEWRWGAGRGSDNIAFLTCGTGMGAGLILNGKLYRGASGSAGELGHIRLAPFGPAGYGKEGSFEGFCSGGGISQLAGIIYRRAVQRGYPLPAGADISRPMSARETADAARSGDKAALEVFEICGRMLGRGLAILIDLLNPEKIIIGSIYTRCEDLLAPFMMEEAARVCLPRSLEAVSIVPAMLDEAIGDYAALCVAEYGFSIS